MTVAKRGAPGLLGWMGASSIPSRGPGHQYEPPAGCHLLLRGCKLPLQGKPKAGNKRARSPPARDRSLPGQHGHSHPPPLPLPPVRLAACLQEQHLSFAASTTKSLCTSAPILPAALSTHAVFMQDLPHTVATARSLPPSCSAGFPEPHFRCSWAPGKGTKEPFSSPASPGAEREGERTDQCLQNTTIGRKFSSGFFFFSLPLFKEGRHSIRTV